MELSSLGLVKCVTTRVSSQMDRRLFDSNLSPKNGFKTLTSIYRPISFLSVIYKFDHELAHIEIWNQTNSFMRCSTIPTGGGEFLYKTRRMHLTFPTLTQYKMTPLLFKLFKYPKEESKPSIHAPLVKTFLNKSSLFCTKMQKFSAVFCTIINPSRWVHLKVKLERGSLEINSDLCLSRCTFYCRVKWTYKKPQCVFFLFQFMRHASSLSAPSPTHLSSVQSWNDSTLVRFKNVSFRK